MVGFSGKSRVMGEDAKAQANSNLRNTCSNLKRFVGKFEGDPQIEVERSRVPFQLTFGKRRDVCAQVCAFWLICFHVLCGGGTDMFGWWSAIALVFCSTCVSFMYVTAGLGHL